MNPTSPMRTFDPRKVAYYEKESWVAYYQRKWFRLLRLLIGLIRSTFGLSLLQAIYISVPSTRAQIAFAPQDNDVPGAEAFMRRFYEFVKSVHHENFDPTEAAQLEVNWWVVHRKYFGQSDDPEVIEAVAKLYASVYQVPIERVREAAYHRAQAMIYSDAWVQSERDPNSPLLKQEEEALFESYAALREAVSTPTAA